MRQRKLPCLAHTRQCGGRHPDHPGVDPRLIEAAGVAAVTFPSVALFTAAQAVRQAMAALKRDHSLAALGEALIPLPDYDELIGLKVQLAREESYDRAAAAMVSKRAAE